MWPMRVGGRALGRQREGEEWLAQQVDRMRTERKGQVVALGRWQDGPIVVAADFAPCGCGAIVWSHYDNWTIAITQVERIQCTDHEGER
jgi:hypothetical protein